MTVDLKGAMPESWACIDCGVNTAPGCSTREQLEQAFSAGTIRNDQGSAEQTINNNSEVYMVKAKIWKAARMGGYDGCLCIGCLEERIGRQLVSKDFMRNHPFNVWPGSRRLLQRRGD
jgi:hypothetical protein